MRLPLFILFALLSLTVLTGCGARGTPLPVQMTQTPPLPPVPPLELLAPSPHYKVVNAADPPPTPTSYLLAWDDFLNTPSNTVYEVWKTDALSPSGWSLWATTSNRSLAMPTTGTSGFFKVRAVNTQTGLVSDWNI